MINKFKYLILVITILIVGCSASPSDHFYTSYPDINKNFRGDKDMCWAAVAANMLNFAGYVPDANATFKEFKNIFDDGPNLVEVALQTYADKSDYFYYGISYMLIDVIVEQLHLSNAVAIYIKSESNNIHVMSVYGYTYISKTEIILHHVDSDDRKYILYDTNFKFDRIIDYWVGNFNGTDIKLIGITVLKTNNKVRTAK